MLKYEEGGLVELSNNKAYILTKIVSDGSKRYVWLSTTTDPIEILFAEIIREGNDESLRVVTEKQEKIDLLKLFATP